MRIILPLLALVAGLFAAYSLLSNRDVAPVSVPPSSPPVADFPQTIGAVGLVEPNSENVTIGTALPGVVQKVFVKVGDLAEAGRELFKLDTRQVEADLEVRRAALVTAQARAGSAQIALDDATDQLRRSERLTQTSAISADELTRRKFAVKIAEARLAEATADVLTAEAQIKSTQTDVERSIVRAPMDGTVLQLNVRPGQFAGTLQTAEPLLVLGHLQPLHVRVDVDEYEGWRVSSKAAAVAHVRGNAELKVPLKFVRFEAMVKPKRSLTGDSIERIDTRVLQVIYEITEENLRLFVGQQMDVFIEDLGEQPTTRPVGTEASPQFRGGEKDAASSPR